MGLPRAPLPRSPPPPWGRRAFTHFTDGEAETASGNFPSVTQTVRETLGCKPHMVRALPTRACCSPALSFIHSFIHSLTTPSRLSTTTFCCLPGPGGLQQYLPIPRAATTQPFSEPDLPALSTHCPRRTLRWCWRGLHPASVPTAHPAWNLKQTRVLEKRGSGNHL